MMTFPEFEPWLTRLITSVALGGIVGFERQFHGRPAGLRTHIMVCLGATLITLAGVVMAGGALAQQGVVRMDPGRIAAGVITGIGFLGGGAILRTGDLVRGLTTAACIWFTAGLGVVIGFGLLPLAIAATAVAVITLVCLVYLEDLIPPFYYRDIHIIGQTADPNRFEQDCRALLSGYNIRIREVETEIFTGTQELRVVFHLQIRGANLRTEIMPKLSAVEGVRQVAWKRHQQEP